MPLGGSFLLEVFVAALITDLATGLGAVPFFFVKEIPRAYYGFAWGLAAGLMLAASVIDLVVPGLQLGSASHLVVGALVGVGFYLAGERFVETRDIAFEDVKDADSVRRIILILGVMTVHSFPEGFAIGLAFISGVPALGIILALAIAIHNIPEGLAISIPLKAEGISTWRCVGYAILSSVPQPIAAVIVVLGMDLLQPYLTGGFGFAAGAMLALVGLEMIPEGREYGQDTTFVIGTVVGAVVMYGINVAISFPGV